MSYTDQNECDNWLKCGIFHGYFGAIDLLRGAAFVLSSVLSSVFVSSLTVFFIISSARANIRFTYSKKPYSHLYRNQLKSIMTMTHPCPLVLAFVFLSLVVSMETLWLKVS